MTLSLQNYTLSIGHCKALARSCPKFKEGVFNRIVLDNCGVDDGEFASILQGLKTMKDFKKIIYRYNSFGEESLAEIKDLLDRKLPFHLDELRIENC